MRRPLGTDTRGLYWGLQNRGPHLLDNAHRGESGGRDVEIPGQNPAKLKSSQDAADPSECSDVFASIP
eukprot:3474208-Pyramimonas_sp.AAC.1